MAHPLGSLVVIDVTFSVDGDLVDPTTWRVVVTKPDATEETLVYGVAGQLVRLSEGTFEIRISTDRADFTQVGRWCWWISSTGTGQGSTNGFFRVTDPRC